MHTEQFNRYFLLTACSVLERLGVFVCTSNIVIGDWTWSRECRKFRVVGGVFVSVYEILYYVYISLYSACIINLFIKISSINYIYIYICVCVWSPSKMFIQLPFLVMYTKIKWNLIFQY
jgi:hypothetical protein